MNMNTKILAHDLAISSEQLAKLAVLLPQEKNARRRYLKDQAELLAQTRGLGAPKIKRQLDKEYGSDNVPSERLISDWISGLGRGGESGPEWKPWNEHPVCDDLGFLFRLDLIKRSEIVQMLVVGSLDSTEQLPGLTITEAKVAVKLQASLQDLDPVIQLLLVHEYAERLASHSRPITADLDLLVATQPWRGSQLYKEMIGKGAAPQVLVRSLYGRGFIEMNAKITDAPRLVSESEPIRRINRLNRDGDLSFRVQMWAWDQLKVPWNLAFDHTDPDTKDVLTVFLKIKEKNDGDARQLVEDRGKFSWEFLLQQDAQVKDKHISTTDSETSND